MSYQLTDNHVAHLEGALNCISQTLGKRLHSHTKSRVKLDIYEAITAGIYLMSSAASPQFVSRESRIRSFTAASSYQASGGFQSAEEMAESGFYYTGEADHVKCFFCDLGLRDWAPSDLPETEHAKFSPLCFFLKSSRGLDWLRNSTPRPPNYPASYLRQDHNELIHLLSEEMMSPCARIACGVGFPDTIVLLCIARKFIRFRQKYDKDSLVKELQSEWDKEILAGDNRGPMFVSQFDLASVLKSFNP